MEEKGGKNLIKLTRCSTNVITRLCVRRGWWHRSAEGTRANERVEQRGEGRCEERRMRSKQVGKTGTQIGILESKIGCKQREKEGTGRNSDHTPRTKVMNIKQRGGGCCPATSALTVVVNKKDDRCFARRRKQSAPRGPRSIKAWNQRRGCDAAQRSHGSRGGGSSPCDRAENTDAGPPPSHNAALLLHTILQLHHHPYELFVSYVTSNLAAFSAANHMLRSAAAFIYTCDHHNIIEPNTSKLFLLMGLKMIIFIKLNLYFFAVSRFGTCEKSEILVQ